MQTPKLLITRPKPTFSNYFSYDPSEDTDLQLEKLVIAREKWREDCKQWRESNRPALLKILGEPLPSGENNPPQGENNPPQAEEGRGYTDLVWKTALAYIGILLGYQIFEVFL